MIRALIVDDEALAREGIRVRLQRETDIEVVGEAADGVAAIEAITTLGPDLIFLDVQMPGCDGFEVLNRTGGSGATAVIFVSAYDRYAVRAFEARGLDYLLKPFSVARFQEALRRARRDLASRADSPRAQKADMDAQPSGQAAPHGAGDMAGRPAYVQRFTVKDRDRFLLVKAEEVDWIESAGNYAQLHARGRVFLIRMTMADLEGRLDPSKFTRIHRTTIVNLDRILEIRTPWHGDFEVALHDGTALRLSRSYRDRVLSKG